MFGFLKPSPISLSGLLWKSPWRMSQTRKANVRKRIKQVDAVIAACAQTGLQTKSLDAAKALPMLDELSPKNKYSTFTPKGKNFRHSIHKVPKFTKKTFRVNPTGF